MDGGSKEYWAMCESMTQLYRVGEEERVLVKPFRRVKSMTTHGKETPANFSASSRGNTGGVLFRLTGRTSRVGGALLLWAPSFSL